MANNIDDLTSCSNLDVNEVKLETPVQGTVWKVVSKAGQTVEAGETVLVVESMKMEIPIVAEADSSIVEVRCNEGDSVIEEQVLLIVEPD